MRSYALAITLVLAGCAHSRPGRSASALPEATRSKQSAALCSSLRFERAGDRVRIPDAPLLQGGGEPMTIEAWIRPAAGVVDEPWHPNIIGKRDDNSVYPPWVLGIGPELQLYTVANGQWVYGETRVPLRRWTHLAVVFDTEELRAYVGGVLDLRVPASRLGPANAGAVFLGALGSGAQRYVGDIASVRVSSVARYRERFVPAHAWAADASTLLSLTMSEGEGDVVHDASGHGHDGRILGARWIHECP